MIAAARAMAGLPAVREVCRLMMNGVPWAEAWRMSPARRLALIVTFGELNGGQFSWESLEWKAPA